MWHIYITGFSSSEHHFKVFHELAQVSCKYFNTKQVVQEEEGIANNLLAKYKAKLERLVIYISFLINMICSLY